MTRTNLTRLGGLAVVLGGLLAATINTLNFVLIQSMGRPLESFARGSLFVLLELLGVAIALFLATGLTGLYALLGRRSRPGISGLVLAYLSVLASLSFVVFAIVYVSYQLLTDTDGSIRNPWVIFPENAVDLAGALLLGGGVLLLGAIVFKDRVLGRWSVLPLILGFLYLTLSLLYALVFYLGWTEAPLVLSLGPLAILRAACGYCWEVCCGLTRRAKKPKTHGARPRDDARRRIGMTDGALRLGILGAARISLGGIIPAAARTDAVEVAAVATRGGEKARAVREAAPEAELFEDYASLLASAKVDAVYVPLPNSMHVEWTLEALEAGKHVLCEKPFSLDAEGAERAIETATSARLALMEGFMYRLHPQTIRLAQLLREGAVGEVRQAVAEFGHRLDDPEDVRGVGALGGGSLGDVGCYCVSGLRLVFGAEPRRAVAFGQFVEDGADRDLAGVLEFDEGLAFVSCSISSARRERLEIVGTDGRITLNAPFRPDKAGGKIEILRGDEPSTEHFGQSDPYRLELEEFAAAIRDKRDPAVGPHEILGNARTVEAILDSARSGGNPREV